MKLWHCKNARSLRPLWALEEMGLEYELDVMPFPPRYLHKEFMKTNPLGTIPYLIDGETTMTESSGICLYLVEKYDQPQLGLKPDHPDYGDYLNWLFHSDATLTFPQAIYLRYSQLEPDDRKQPEVAEAYKKWFFKRLIRLDAHIKEREFLCDDRFTIADIAIGYALHLGKVIGLSDEFTPQVQSYLERLSSRPAFIRAQSKS